MVFPPLIVAAGGLSAIALQGRPCSRAGLSQPVSPLSRGERDKVAPPEPALPWQLSPVTCSSAFQCSETGTTGSPSAESAQGSCCPHLLCCSTPALLPHISAAPRQGLPLLAWCHGSKSECFDAAALGSKSV